MKEAQTITTKMVLGNHKHERNKSINNNDGIR